MAQLLSAARTASLQRCPLVQPFLYLQIRGKKQVKTDKARKSRKELQKEMMRDYLKKTELEKLVCDATLKSAKKGEALDPETLNPIRKRAPVVLTKDEQERRFLMVKAWSRVQMENHKQEQVFLQGIIRNRQQALNELKRVSFPLYAKALELNPDLFPFECLAPTATPPLSGYTPPDPE